MDKLFQIYNVSKPTAVKDVTKEENKKDEINITYKTISVNTSEPVITAPKLLATLSVSEDITPVALPKINVTSVSSDVNTNVKILSTIPSEPLQLQSSIANNANVIIPQTAFNENTLYFGEGGGGMVSGVAPISAVDNVISLNNSTVAPGVYTLAQITVDEKGIIQDASSGIIPPNDDWSNFPAQTNVDMSGNLIENLGVPTKPNDATTKDYVDTAILTLTNDISGNYVNLTTAQDISGVKTFMNVPVCSTQPTTNNELANKIYVDNAVGGVPIGNYLPLAGGTMSGNIDMSGNDLLDVGTINAGGVTESATFGSTLAPMLNHDVYATNVSVNSYNPLSAMNFIGVGGVNINAPDEDINLNAGDINLTQTQATSFMNLTATGSIVIAGAVGVGITSVGTIQMLASGDVSIGSGNILGSDTEIEKVGFKDNTIYMANTVGATNLEISDVALIENNEADLTIQTTGSTGKIILTGDNGININTYIDFNGAMTLYQEVQDSTTSLGTAGQVLTALADGKVKWETPTPIDVSGAKGFYGSFYDTTDQTNLTTINTFAYNTTAEALGVSIVSGTRITMANAGTYNIQFSAVFTQTNSSASLVDIWLRKNGNDVPESNTQFKIAGNGQTVEAWNFMLTVNAGDYLQLVWYSPESTMRIEAIPAQVTPTRPAVPSIILTVQQVMFTQLGATIDGSNNYFLIKDGVNTATTTDVISTNGTDLNVKNSINLGTFGDGISNDITFNIASGNGGQIYWDSSGGNIASISLNEPENTMRIIAPTYQMFSTDDSQITVGSISGLGITMATRNKFINITRYDNAYSYGEGVLTMPGGGVIQIGDESSPAAPEPSLRLTSNITGTPQYGNISLNGTTGDIIIDTNLIIDNSTNTTNTIKATGNSVMNFTNGTTSASLTYNASLNRLTTLANRLAFSANNTAIEMGGGLGGIFVTCPSNNSIVFKRTDKTELSIFDNGIINIGNLALATNPTLQFQGSSNSMKLVYNNTNDRLEITDGDLYALQNIKTLGNITVQGAIPSIYLNDVGGTLQAGLTYTDSTDEVDLYGPGDINIEPATNMVINTASGSFYYKNNSVENFYVSGGGNTMRLNAPSGGQTFNMNTALVGQRSEIQFTWGTPGSGTGGYGIYRPVNTGNLAFYSYPLARNQLVFEGSNGETQFIGTGGNTVASMNANGAFTLGSTVANQGQGFLNLYRTTTDSNSTGINLYKNRNGGNTLDGDNLGYVQFIGYSSSNYQSSAYISCFQEGAGTYVPARLAFYTGNTTAPPVERMRITSAGSVGIGNRNGNTPASTQLYVSTTDGGGWAGFAYFGGSSRGVIAGSYPDSGGTHRATIGGHTQNVGAWDKLTINPGGNVGIGAVYDPGYQLQLAVDSAFKPGSAGLWTYTSDIRIKKNIEDADLGICFNNIKNMKLRRYEWNSEYYDEKAMKDRKVIGFIAQEVKEVFPKAVDINPKQDFVLTQYDESGNVIMDEISHMPKTIVKTLDNVHSVNGDQIMNTHIGATQMLIKKVETLETINASLIARLEALEAKINNV